MMKNHTVITYPHVQGCKIYQVKLLPTHHVLCFLHSVPSLYLKGVKMLKDVGMTVPKSRETSVVYIYAAIQGMRDYIYMQQDRG